MSAYRPSALVRLHSPERLDQLPHTAHPRGWLVLAGACGFLSAALLWACFGSVSTSVRGQGVLIRPGGTYNVCAQGSGVITEVFTDDGRPVRKGQLLARIDQPVLRTEIRLMEAQIRELKAEYDKIVRLYAQSDHLYAEATKQQRTNISLSIDAYQARLVKLRELQKVNREGLATQQKQAEFAVKALEQQVATADEETRRATGLLNSKAMSQKDYDSVVRNRDDLRVKLLTARTDLAKHIAIASETALVAHKEEETSLQGLQDLRNESANISKEEAERSTKRVEELFVKEQEIRREEGKLRALQTRHALESEVYSPYDGRIVELTGDPGMITQVGAPLCSVEVLEGKIEAVLYLPAAEGKKVSPGMQVEITPSTVKREEFGFVVGRVRTTSGFLASEEGIRRLLPNKALVDKLTKEGVSVEVMVDLETDEATPTHYRWSSGKGPSGELQSGTLCTAYVRVREQPPITLVIPAFKKFFALD